MRAERLKRVLIIAGPNGAGKTTFASEFLPRDAGVFAFVNADLIAAGLSPFDPAQAAVRAGRLMVRAIQQHVTRGEDFAFETTLAGRRYARAIPSWQDVGYRVGMVFLGLQSAELAIARVAMRVRQGGHGVPDEVVRRRFESGRENFEQVFKALVDDWWLFDNSGPRRVLIDRGERE